MTSQTAVAPSTIAPALPGPVLAPAIMVIVWLCVTMFLWMFAFWHTPGATPEWLLRAQAACFGTSSTGLPDTYGWTVLVLAPLSLLLAIVTSYGGEIRIGMQRISRSPSAAVLLSLLIGGALVEAVWVCGRIRTGLEIASKSYAPENDEALPDGYPQLQETAAAFSLVDQQGERRSLESLRGKTVILTFAFAHCQTVCPAIVRNVVSAAQELPREQTAVAIITLDPWRDTPSSLPSLAEQWDLAADQYALSGPPGEVEQVHRSYRMSIQRDAKTGDVVHPALVYIIDPQGTIRYLFNNPPTAWLVEAAKRSLKSRS